jgi:hypothetical protein
MIRFKCTPGFFSLLAYTVIAVALFFPLIQNFSTHILADDIFIRPGLSDAYNFYWTYWWMQKALTHGLQFFQCNWVLPPTGANLIFHTNVLAPTLMTLPISTIFGLVPGYNTMILLMLIFAAWGYFLFLRTTFNSDFLSAFISGGCFGFCPYFVFKTHAHLNLICACFWAGALELLINFYLRDNRRWKNMMLFALLFWGTFWSSFVGFFMQVIFIVIVIVTFEIYAFFAQGNRNWGRTIYLLPTLLGGVSLVLLAGVPISSTINRTINDSMPVSDLFSFPLLGFLSDYSTTSSIENAGTYIPYSYLALSVIGFFIPHKMEKKDRLAIGIFLIVSLLLTLNPLQILSNIIKWLPGGHGFRVYSRFFPYFLFFLLILFNQGVSAIVEWSFKAKKWVLMALLSVIVFELYPCNLNPSKVKQIFLSPEVRSRIDPSDFVILSLRGPYVTLDDTYQVCLDLPFVYLSDLSRENPETIRFRKENFPIVYNGVAQNTPERLRAELSGLKVKYILFEDKKDLVRMPFPGTIIETWSNELLFKLD